MSEEFISNVRASSPFPWRHIIIPPNRVVVIDAKDAEVPMFTMIEYACMLTNIMNKPEKKQDDPQPEKVEEAPVQT